MEMEISHNVIHNFIYGVKIQAKTISEYLVQEKNLPELQSSKTYYPKTYFGDTRAGYDVQYFTKDELISDVLKHYERFIEITAEESNEMFTSK
jgi:choline/glycine/proline betaine transport protein